MILIGLSGRRRSGKDTAYKVIHDVCKERNINCERFAFADEVKKAACRASGNRIDFFTEDEAEKEKIRPILQMLGTECFRQYDYDWWIHLAFENIMRYETAHPDGVAVITDIRFKNELYEVANLNGHIIRLTRTVGNDEHNSERELDEVEDFFLNAPDRWLAAMNVSIIEEALFPTASSSIAVLREKTRGIMLRILEDRK